MIILMSSSYFEKLQTTFSSYIALQVPGRHNNDIYDTYLTFCTRFSVQRSQPDPQPPSAFATTRAYLVSLTSNASECIKCLLCKSRIYLYIFNLLSKQLDLIVDALHSPKGFGLRTGLIQPLFSLSIFWHLFW